MLRPLPPPPPYSRSGFVLLHTLFVLLACAVVVGGLSAAVRSRARDAEAALDSLRLEAAAEAGVHRALFALLAQRDTSQHSFNLDGYAVRVTVQPTDALPNLLTLDRPATQRVVFSLFGAEGTTVLNALTAGKRATTYTTLAAKPGVGHSRMMRLAPHTTLHSDGNAATPHPSPLGKIYRFQSQARIGDRASRVLLVEARLTGQGAHPLWVYEWFWLHDIPAHP